MSGKPMIRCAIYDRHPDPTRRELVINESEAEHVQDVFQLYKTHGCLRLVECAANALGIRSKKRTFASGRTSGGGVLSRGQIHYLLTNPIYAGLIRHKDTTWPGLHTRIVEEPLWESVQTKLRAASARPRGRTTKQSRDAQTEPLLVGKFRDETGDRLTPSHTKKSGRRFRYYVSNRLLSGGAGDASGWRLPAASFEATVFKLVAAHIETRARLHRILQDPDVACSRETSARAIKLAQSLTKKSGSQLNQLLSSGTLSKGNIKIQLDLNVFANALGVPDSAIEPNVLNFDAPFKLRRRGVETKIIAGETAPTPDMKLIKLLSKAHDWSDALRNGRRLIDIAKDEQLSDGYIGVRSQLAYLSPRIQKAILNGEQPPDLTIKKYCALVSHWTGHSKNRLWGLNVKFQFPVQVLRLPDHFRLFPVSRI